jgi:serine/threonine protein kinase
MVALKVFRSEGSTDEVIEESFRREVQALSDLKHPHIVASSIPGATTKTACTSS